MPVALYARVSAPPSATHSHSIDDQLARLQEHAQRQGWEVPEAWVFRDDGVSGATLRRPGLDRLRDAVASSAVGRVLVTAPDRLARNARPADGAVGRTGARWLSGGVSGSGDEPRSP
jgi:site-specific DNA recombinase